MVLCNDDLVVFFRGDSGEISGDESGAWAKERDVSGREEVNGSLEFVCWALEFKDWSESGGGGLVVIILSFLGSQ